MTKTAVSVNAESLNLTSYFPMEATADGKNTHSLQNDPIYLFPSLLNKCPTECVLLVN